jgi:putative membrane protein
VHHAVPAPPEEPPTGAEAGAGAGAEPDPVPRPRRWAVRLLVGGLALLVMTALGFDTADLIRRAYATSAALGTLVSAVLAVALAGGVGLVAGELRSLTRLRAIDRLRAEAERLKGDDGHGGAGLYAGAVTALYDGRGDMTGPLTALKDQISDAHDDREIVRLIDRQVLRPLDRRAYRLVLRSSRDIAVITTISPSALIDVVVVLWRNLRLVREIAALYGARPGYLGSVRLLRRMLANIAIAGVAETGHELAAHALGSTLTAAISTKVGQGMVNGLLTARVGIAAMHLCRPLAYEPEDRPSLKRIRRELLSVPAKVL